MFLLLFERKFQPRVESGRKWNSGAEYSVDTVLDHLLVEVIRNFLKIRMNSTTKLGFTKVSF